MRIAHGSKAKQCPIHKLFRVIVVTELSDSAAVPGGLRCLEGGFQKSGEIIQICFAMKKTHIMMKRDYPHVFLKKEHLRLQVKQKPLLGRP